MEVFSIDNIKQVESIPHSYAVTDKADGEGYTLFIYDNQVYLMSLNWKVIDVNLKLDKANSSYNNTILVGELIKKNNPLLKERVILLQDVLSKCFDNKFIYKEYTN